MEEVFADVPDAPKTEIPNLFQQVEKEESALEEQRQHDRKVALLITQKKLETLRAFGYDVVKKADSLPPLTTDRRSLES